MPPYPTIPSNEEPGFTIIQQTLTIAVLDVGVGGLVLGY
jgi:hypothetical protein